MSIVNFHTQIILLHVSGVGSTEDYWKRQDAAEVMAQVEWTFMPFQ